MALKMATYCGTVTGQRQTRVFRDWRHACEHLCDHLLTMPEAAAWNVVLGGHGTDLSPNARFHLARRLWDDESQGEAGQRLYDLYAGAIADALDSAEATGWVWTESMDRREDKKVLGLMGVLVVLSLAREGDEHVRTAMLPGMGTPFDATEAGKESDTVAARRRNPLPRERESGGDGGADRAHPQREASMIRRQYKVFRKCANRVRREMLEAFFQGKGRMSGAEELLKRVRDFDEWIRCLDLARK